MELNKPLLKYKIMLKAIIFEIYAMNRLAVPFTFYIMAVRWASHSTGIPTAYTVPHSCHFSPPP